jgi:hypothetical protein
MHWQLFSFASHEFYENEFVVLFTKLRNSVIENARFAFQFIGRSLSFTIHQATFQVPSQVETIGDRAMDILSGLFILAQIDNAYLQARGNSGSSYCSRVPITIT